jgi:hypothetical protein
MRLFSNHWWSLALVVSILLIPSARAGDAQGDSLGEEELAESLFEPSPVAPVAYEALQDGMEGTRGGMAAPAAAPRTAPPRSGSSRTRQASYRLASVPNMYGDIGMSAGRVNFDSGNDPFGNATRRFAGGFDLPAAGGSRRVKIGENNVSLPTDRIFFMYNHFHNVFTVQELSLAPPGPPMRRSLHVDRYTVGFEKMFLDDLWSVEVRLPLNGEIDYTSPMGGFNIDGGNVGNLAIILKNLLYTDESTAVAGGVGIDVPTGSDVDTIIGPMFLHFENEALHILPWIGFLHTFSDDRFFVTGFAQLDLATSGNEVTAPLQNNMSFGRFNEQNLLYLDLAVGHFLYRDEYARRLTSIALMGEAHYTTTVQDTDFIDGGNPGMGAFQLTNPYNRQDIVNGTVALQFEIANTSTFRIGAVAPLSDEADKRLFDAELQVQFNRKF